MSASPATLFSSLRGKARSGILIEGVGLSLVVLIAFMVVSFALDRTLRLDTEEQQRLEVARLDEAENVTGSVNDEVNVTANQCRRYLLGALGAERDLRIEPQSVDSHGSRQAR